MKESTTSDKYDEAARALYFDDSIARRMYFGDNEAGCIKDIADKLRSAFPSAPSVAEDAQEAALMVIRAYNTHVNDDPKEAAAAELEAFARSRVKPWREALQNLVDEQNGPPLIREAATWQSAMDNATKLLSADDAKEAAKEEREIKDLSGTVQFNDGMDD